MQRDNPIRNPLEVYKILSMAKIELAVLQSIINEIKMTRQDEGFSIVHFEQRIQDDIFRLDFFLKSYNKTNIGDQIGSLFKSKESLQNEIERIYQAAGDILKNAIGLRIKFFEITVTSFEELEARLVLIEKFNNIYNLFNRENLELQGALQLMGKNNDSDESKLNPKLYQETQIKRALEKYKLHLNNFKSIILNMNKERNTLIEPNKALGLLVKYKELFISIAHGNLDSWLDNNPQHKDAFIAYKNKFEDRYGRSLELQAALSIFYLKKDNRDLLILLEKNVKLSEFLIKELPLLADTFSAWQQLKELELQESELSSLKHELASGLGKIYGEQYSFPKIVKFLSPNISDLEKALFASVDQLNKILTLSKDSWRLDAGWIYLKQLEKFIDLQKNVFKAQKSFKDFAVIYEATKSALEQIEENYFPDGYRFAGSNSKEARDEKAIAKVKAMYPFIKKESAGMFKKSLKLKKPMYDDQRGRISEILKQEKEKLLAKKK